MSSGMGALLSNSPIGEKRMNLNSLLFILLGIFLISPNSFAGGEDYFCGTSNVKNKTCKKGDLLFVPSPKAALILCDFSKNVVPFSQGDSSGISGQAICHYLGNERKQR
jgi:hypothetical protein